MSEKVLATIVKSKEMHWLTTCRDAALAKGDTVVAEAADRRIRDLELAARLSIRLDDGTLEGRVGESVEVYRALLRHKHGRRQAAGYTEREIKAKTAKGALMATILRGKRTDGLIALAAAGRLDCSYEQIAIDFAAELPDDVVAKARQMMAKFEKEANQGNARRQRRLAASVI